MGHENHMNVKEHKCSQCMSGYGKDSQGKCQPCPHNCEFCGDNSRKCLHCKEGKIINSDGQCTEPPIPNCTSVRSDNGSDDSDKPPKKLLFPGGGLFMKQKC